VPDGTTTGGNSRGQYSVDLQRFRTFNTRVASGNYSSIIGGASNSATGSYSVSGGQNNQATGVWATAIGGGDNSATGNYSNSIGGNLNNATAQFSSVIGGASNTVSSSYSTISGGQSNTASTNTHATVVGGQSNTASGQYSLAGGSGSNATNTRTFAFGGTASGQYSCTIGFACTSSGQISSSFGRSTQATGQYSFSLGNESLSYLQSSQSLSGGQFSAAGDAQQSLLTARRESTLTSAATTLLFLDGASTNIIPNGNNRAWNVQIDTIAVVTAITGTATGISVGHCYRETKQLLFKRIGGTSSIVGTVDTSAIKSDSGMSTASITISAGGSQQMAITFTGPSFLGGGSVTCRVVSKVSLVECAY